MVVVGPGEVKLHEDAPHVFLDRPFGDIEPMGDAIVGAALRHEGEHLALPRRELGERVAPSALGEKLLYESGIDH